MIYCLNPDCQNPINTDNTSFCHSCGTKIIPLLGGRYRMIEALGKGRFGKTYLAEDREKVNQRCIIEQIVPNEEKIPTLEKAVQLFEEAQKLPSVGENSQVQALDTYFEEDGYFYFVQQLITDQLLAENSQQSYADLPSSSLSLSKTRRKFLKFAGFASLGLIGVILYRVAFSHKSTIEEPKTLSSPKSPAKQPSPRKSAKKLTKLSKFSFTSVTVNQQGKIIKRSNKQAQFFSEDINGVPLEMVLIPAGKFLMGSPATEKKRIKTENPQHQVTVASFLMGKYEVTQAQWQAVAALPQINIPLNPNPSYFKGAKRPVEQITWKEAQEFCDRLSRETGRNYRLPSEAEWEYACRAGTTTPFYLGETITTELANYNGKYIYGSTQKGIYREQTTNVGSFPPNAFGLYDMSGNLWEWCADPWHDNYNGATNNGNVWKSGGDNDRRVVRGGSWYQGSGDCRSSRRSSNYVDDWDNLLGFRVVCNVV